MAAGHGLAARHAVGWSAGHRRSGSELAHRWLTLVGGVLLIAVAVVAFVDYERIRAEAHNAWAAADVARARCITSSLPATIAGRERLIARCNELPTPERAADRVERRWEQHRLWYGFGAGAILLPTAVMFSQSRRRRATSSTVDSSARAWRITSIAFRFAVGVLIWLALYHLAMDRWVEFVEATGDTTHDCDVMGAECGTLGEFTTAHPHILIWLFRIGAAIPAVAGIWLLSRLLRSLDPPDQPASVVTAR